jgi:hypothetical protein
MQGKLQRVSDLIRLALPNRKLGSVKADLDKD